MHFVLHSWKPWFVVIKCDEDLGWNTQMLAKDDGVVRFDPWWDKRCDYFLQKLHYLEFTAWKSDQASVSHGVWLVDWPLSKWTVFLGIVDLYESADSMGAVICIVMLKFSVSKSSAFDLSKFCCLTYVLLYKLLRAISVGRNIWLPHSW